MMTRVDERSPETSMTETVIGPCAAGWPDGSMAIHVSGSASATAGTRARLIEPPLGKHPVGTRTPGRCQGAREPQTAPVASKAAGRWRTSVVPSSRTVTATTSKRQRSEEHTSELQSLAYLVCRLLLEKKKIK